MAGGGCQNDSIHLEMVEALEREAADEEFGRLFGLGFTVWWVDIYLWISDLLMVLLVVFFCFQLDTLKWV